MDGFPREIDQANIFESEVGHPTLVIFLECSEETMNARLLKRAETSGRADDNQEVTQPLFDIISHGLLTFRLSSSDSIPSKPNLSQLLNFMCKRTSFLRLTETAPLKRPTLKSNWPLIKLFNAVSVTLSISHFFQASNKNAFQTRFLYE